jgi:galactokinase
MLSYERISEAFARRFGRSARLFRAPGRINLIGEHTDYNDGFSLPFAIDRETVAAVAPRDDRLIRVFSSDLDDETVVDLDAREVPDAAWARYVAGVAFVLEEQGARLRGVDMSITGDVPLGAGLSSSASLEVAAGLALLRVSNAGDLDGMVLARAGQAAEHRFVGTMCGIMDQMASRFARAGSALLIDFASLDVEHVPLDLGDHRLVACDSRVHHELASSEYNSRRRECEEAVSRLAAKGLEVRSLRDVTPAMLDEHASDLPGALLARARHVVTENARTLAAAEALRGGDVVELGRLMTASHRSLQLDYEVSCDELDLLVDVALSLDGVLGARMTGGGFGGSTINLVRRDKLDSFPLEIGSRYLEATGREPRVFEVRAAAGAAEIV